MISCKSCQVDYNKSAEAFEDSPKGVGIKALAEIDPMGNTALDPIHNYVYPRCGQTQAPDVASCLEECATYADESCKIGSSPTFPDVKQT